MTMFDLARVAALSALCLSTAAMATDAGANKQKPAKQGTRVTIHNSPSAESNAERDRRLTRECKGRPNAGACLGYARP
jgi:hypothetical protein